MSGNESELKNGLSNNRAAEGYSKEEEYFYKQNKALIEELRKHLDNESAAVAQGEPSGLPHAKEQHKFLNQLKQIFKIREEGPTLF